MDGVNESVLDSDFRYQVDYKVKFVANFLECADLSALWPVATCRDHGLVESV
jgi:hypothetical protein